MKKTLPILLLIPILYSCNKFFGYKYNSASISSSPVNLEFVNSEYDDYNSTSPILGETFPLCFSSNRRSGGGEYDIIYKLIKFHFSKSSGEFQIEEETNANMGFYIDNKDLNQAVRNINSPADEFGPYLTRRFPNGNSRILLYANNESGNFDIKFTHSLNNEEYDTIASIPYLNSEFDDYYPALNKDSSQIYWCSNRNGQFDILNVELDNSLDLVDRLYDDSEKTIRSIDKLNSSSDDKCPFIMEDFMVFASDRAGGFGGFDLYYSEKINGKWSDPKNFGPEINSEYDEYRPIIRPQEHGFTNDLMIFSSNRPGGLGGFDLYYVGIEKIKF
ncbi:MAG: hypothetical protein ACQETL_09655 [Bacteroidota bacterium]